MLASTRRFFSERSVMEVETPIALSHTVTDVQIHSFTIQGDPPRYLHSSPEYAMKRLLASGSGDIFQICKVFRAEEQSRQHNPEFTMIEWYRLGFGLHEIMTETAQLVALLLQEPTGAPLPVELLSYNDALQRELGCDAFESTTASLAAQCAEHGLMPQSIASASRDDLLDFLIATQVGPRLGQGKLTCLHHYPASQAALAEIDAQDPRTALRFELYAQGMELANGYVELASSAEQQQRFTQDLQLRRARGLPAVAVDKRLLAAIDAGLPRCAGVAMGFDRVAMLALGCTHIAEVMAFPWERA
jgi:lysyl-tRNA synthetase class 2